jgi:hypothetical protein
MNLLTPNAHCLAGQLVERRGAQVKVDVNFGAAHRTTLGFLGLRLRCTIATSKIARTLGLAN